MNPFYRSMKFENKKESRKKVLQQFFLYEICVELKRSQIIVNTKFAYAVTASEFGTIWKIWSKNVHSIQSGYLGFKARKKIRNNWTDACEYVCVREFAIGTIWSIQNEQHKI